MPRTVLALSALVAFAALAADAGSGRSASRDVLIYSVGGSASDLCAVGVDGRNPRRLTRGPGADSDPTASPDGKRVAFVSNLPGYYDYYEGQIHVVQANGRGRRNATLAEETYGNDHQPSWSPNGRWIAFSLFPARGDYGGRLHVMTPDGGIREVLRYGVAPDWSPNGRQLVYGSGASFDPGLRIADSDGRNERVLTTSGSGPSWSPDGRSVVFSDLADPTTGFSQELYVVAVEGTNRRRLTFDNVQDYDPVWSSDGSQIAFVRGAPGTIHVINSDGSGLRRLTRSRYAESSPEWVRTSAEIGLAPRQDCAPSIVGRAGPDRMSGTSGDDALYGLAGNDLLRGRAGRDYLSGGAGSDRVEARDGLRDEVFCGPGRDRAVADRRDRVASDCERVSRL